MVLIHQRYRQTDRQADDMQSQYRALHYSASRGKKFRLYRVICVVPVSSCYSLNVGLSQEVGSCLSVSRDIDDYCVKLLIS